MIDATDILWGVYDVVMQDSSAFLVLGAEQPSPNLTDILWGEMYDVSAGTRCAGGG
jgi:hypothetical protein